MITSSVLFCPNKFLINNQVQNYRFFIEIQIQFIVCRNFWNVAFLGGGKLSFRLRFLRWMRMNSELIPESIFWVLVCGCSFVSFVHFMSMSFKVSQVSLAAKQLLGYGFFFFRRLKESWLLCVWVSVGGAAEQIPTFLPINQILRWFWSIWTF